MRLFKGIQHLYRLVLYVWDNPSNRGQRVRRSLMVVLWQVYKRTVGLPLVVTLDNGRRFIAEPKSGNSTGVIYTRLYEPEYTLFLREVFAGRDPSAAIDIGAHVGLFSLQLAHLFSDIYCFEPAPDTYKLLLQNIAINSPCNMRPFQLAVSDTPGSVSFELTGQFSGTNRIARNRPTAQQVVTVSATALDVFFLDRGESPDIAFLKIDTEGHEVAVLEGARGTLARSTWPVLLVENCGSDRISGIAKTLSLDVFALIDGRLSTAPDKLRTAYNLILTRRNDPALAKWRAPLREM